MTELERRIAALIARRLGLDCDRLHVASVRRALDAARRDLGLDGLAALADRLAGSSADDPAWRRVAAHLTVPESRFFRHPKLLAAIERRVLAPLIESRRHAGPRRLRLWSAGCAGGEEPYTLALMLDRLIPDREAWQIEIVATDISEDAIARVEAGRYRARAARPVPPDLAGRLLRRAGRDEVAVDASLRAMVRPSLHNLVAPEGAPAPSGCDLVLCRNVIMYMTAAAQADALATLAAALAPEGWLVLGPAEVSAGRVPGLTAVPESEALFFRRPRPGEAPSAAADDAAPELPVSEPSRSAPPVARAPASPVVPRASSEPRPAGAAEAEDVGLLDASAWRRRAAEAEERGDLAAAEVARRRVVYLGGDAAADRFLLGALLQRRGKHREARRSLEGALEAASRRAAGDPRVPDADLSDGRLAAAARRLLEAGTEAPGESRD